MTVFRRQWILTIRNRAFARAQVAQALIQGLLIGTVFFKLSSTDYITRYGFCFTTMMALSLAAMAQIPQIIKERNVYYKQRSANFFRTQTYVWASVLSQPPFSLITTTLMSVLVYSWRTCRTHLRRTFFHAYSSFSRWVWVCSSSSLLLQCQIPRVLYFISCSVLILVLMSGYIIQQMRFNPISSGFTTFLLFSTVTQLDDQWVQAKIWREDSRILESGWSPDVRCVRAQSARTSLLSIHLHLFLSIHLLRHRSTTLKHRYGEAYSDIKCTRPILTRCTAWYSRDCALWVFSVCGCISLFRLLKSGGEVMVSDGDEGNDDPACDVETKSEDSLRDPSTNKKRKMMSRSMSRTKWWFRSRI